MDSYSLAESHDCNPRTAARWARSHDWFSRVEFNENGMTDLETGEIIPYDWNALLGWAGY